METVIDEAMVETSANNDIGDMVSVIRGAVGIKDYSKKRLAKQLKISKPLLSQYLHGDREMPIELIARTFELLFLDRIERDQLIASTSL